MTYNWFLITRHLTLPPLAIPLLLTTPARAQYVAQELLAAIDSVEVSVIWDATSEAEYCLPFESTIQNRLELAFQRAGLSVVDFSPAIVGFSAVAIYPNLCAVSYRAQVRYYLHSVGIPTYAVGLSSGGLFTRRTTTESRAHLREMVDDAADTIINQIMKAYRNR